MKNGCRWLVCLLLFLWGALLPGCSSEAQPDFLNQIYLPELDQFYSLGMARDSVAQQGDISHRNEIKFLDGRLARLFSYRFSLQGIGHGSSYDELTAVFGEPDDASFNAYNNPTYSYFFDRQGQGVSGWEEAAYLLRFRFRDPEMDQIHLLCAFLILDFAGHPAYTVIQPESGLTVTLGGDSTALEPFRIGESETILLDGLQCEVIGGRIVDLWADCSIWASADPALGNTVTLQALSETFDIPEDQFPLRRGNTITGFSLDADGHRGETPDDSFIGCSFHLDHNEYSFEGVTFQKGSISFTLYYSIRYGALG